MRQNMAHEVEVGLQPEPLTLNEPRGHRGEACIHIGDLTGHAGGQV
jgi:hypothetical protein